MSDLALDPDPQNDHYSGMPDRPRIPSPGVPRVPRVPRSPGTGSARPGVGSAPRRGATSRASYAKLIKRLVARVRAVDAEFYSIGKELLALDTPEVLTVFGHSTFREFVDARVMSYDRAYRFMVVAEAYPKSMALSLGVEKGFHLVQYAEVARARFTARDLAERDSRLGASRRRVSELSARDVQNLVRVAKMTRARAAKPRPTTREKRAVSRLGREFEERFGVDATVRVDKARDVVRIEVKLSEWMGGE